ncbi:MAG TPA: autotransporter-associated beta strand repeat-containing protein, partial [Pirellulales bacterium]
DKATVIAVSSTLIIGNNVSTTPALVQYVSGAGPDQIAVGAGVTVNLGGTLDLNGINDTVNSLTFGGGGSVISSGGTSTLTINPANNSTSGTAILYYAGEQATISTNLDLGGLTRTVNVGDGLVNDDLQITGVVSDGGISKVGAGGLLLSNSGNSYGEVNQATNLTIPTTVTGASIILTIDGNVTNPIAYTGSSMTAAQMQAAINAAGMAAPYAGSFHANDIVVTGPTTAGVYTLTFNGDYAGEPVTVAVALTAAETGTGTISVATAIVGGGTILNGGILDVGSNTALGTGVLTLTSGSLWADSTGSSSITLANSFIINGASITLGGRRDFGGTSALTLLSAAPLTVQTATATITVDDPQTVVTLAGNISENLVNRGITKASNGTLVLAGNNSYTGLTTVTAGVLEAASNNALGAVGQNAIQTVTLSATTTALFSTAAFTLAFNGSTVAVSSGESASQLANAMNQIASIAGVGGSVTVSKVQTSSLAEIFYINFGGSLGSSALPLMTTSGVSSGGTATVATLLTGELGTTVASGAELDLVGNLTIGDEPLTLTGGLGFGGNINGVGEGPGALRNISGTSTWGNGTTTFTLGPTTANIFTTLGADSGQLTLNGSIMQAVAGDGLNKVGAGTIVFAGPTANGYTGQTTINDGTLVLAKTAPNALQGAVVVGDNISGAATLDLATAEQILDTAAVTINSDGQLDSSTSTSTPSSTVQNVTVTASGGTFTLGYDGVASAAIPYNSSAATVQSTLDTLLAQYIPGASVSVTANTSGTTTVYTITFAGSLAGANVPALSFGNSLAGGTGAVSVATPGNNATQTLTVSSGTQFTLTYNGQTTAPINVGAPANPSGGTGDVQDALAALSTIGAGNVAVYGTTVSGVSVYTIEFVGALAGASVSTISATTTAASSLPSLAGSSTSGTNTTQAVEITASAGQFTLNYGSQTTALLAFNATAAQVQTALNAIMPSGGSVTVSTGGGSATSGGAITTIYSITFTGISSPSAITVNGSPSVSALPSATYSAGLDSPDAIAFDPHGNLYVANELNNTVSEFAPGSTTPIATYSTSLQGPSALAFDSSGNLYVANGGFGAGNNTVVKFAAGSTTPSATYSAGLSYPQALAFDASGNLYVASYGDNTVVKFAAGSTTPAATYPVLAPQALAIDSSGDLYVGDASFPNANVVKFAAGSTTSSAVYSAGLDWVKALAIDSSGNLYVASYNDNTVVEFPAGSTTASATYSTGVSKPTALAFDSSGNLYVANYYGGSGNDAPVSEFAPGSTTPSATYTASIGEPIALAFDPSGNLYVESSAEDAVTEFAKGSTTLGATYNTGLVQPQALAFDSGGDLYVMNRDNDSVSEFGSGSTTVPIATYSAGLSTPAGMVFDSSGNLYVANFEGVGSGTVTEFAPGSTTPSATYTTGAGRPGPDSLALDSHGNLYVANYGANTVVEFAPGNTTPIATYSTGVEEPDALAFDASGNLYVSNLGSDTVTKFAPGSTTPIATYSTSLSLGVPIAGDHGALALDASGNLYVANYGNNTVSEFAPGSTTPSAVYSTGLNEPYALAIDSRGNLYVANLGNYTVSEFSPGSTAPGATYSSGFNAPSALAFDSKGDLYVAAYGGYVNEFSAATPLSVPAALANTGIGTGVANGNVLTQTVTVQASAGNFTLTYGGQTTVTPLAFNASAATVQTALQGLSSVGAGNATVTSSSTTSFGNTNTTYTVTFAGTITAGTVLPIVGTSSGLALAGGSASVAVSGVGGANTVSENTPANTLQTVTLTLTTAGTFTLGFDGLSTVALPFNAPDSVVQSALDTLVAQIVPGGSVMVSANVITTTSIYYVTFVGSFAGMNLPAMTATASGFSSGAVAVAVANPGDDATQTLSLSGTGGQFTLTYNGQTTSPLSLGAPANSSGGAGDVQDALAALSTIGAGNVAVYGTTSGGVSTYLITFTGALAGVNATPIVANTTGLATLPNLTSTSASSNNGTQTLEISSSSGQFTLSYGGSTTPALVYNATASAVQTALNNLPAIAGVSGTTTVTASTATVSGVTTTIYKVVFTSVPSPTAIVINGTGMSASPSATFTGLGAPEGMAFDSSGNLYAANYEAGGAGTTVSVFAPGSTTPTSTLTGLSGPTFIAFDSSGNIYVTNAIGNTVSEFSPGGTTPVATLTGLNFPTALAFDTSGNLYVVNRGGGSGTTVSVFAPGSTTPTSTLTGLSSPSSLAFDSSGNLYVTNQTSNTVSEFAPGSTTPTATLTGLSDPEYLAFNSAGNLYVANSGNGTVSVFAPGSTTPTSTLIGLSTPNALAFDSSGNLYVSNHGSSTISVFASGSTSASSTLAGLSKPEALVFDSSGNLYVSNFNTGTVSEFIPGSLAIPAASLNTGIGTGVLNANVLTQTVTVVASGGQFTLTYNGGTTTALAYNASNSTVQAALLAVLTAPPVSEAGATVGVTSTATTSGGVTTTLYTITFGGSILASGGNGARTFNVVPLVATSVSLAGATAASSTVLGIGQGTAGGERIGAITMVDGQNSSAAINLSPGTSLSLGGNITVNAFPGITSSGGATITGGTINLQYASAALAATRTITVNDGPAFADLTISSVLADGSPFPATLSKAGTGFGRLVLAGANTYTGATTVTTGELTAENSQALGAGVNNQLQSVAVAGGSGTFTITFAGATTTALANTASAADVQAAINALFGPSVLNLPGASVSVTTLLTNPSTFIITFLGTLGDSELPAITTAVTGSTTATVNGAGTFDLGGGNATQTISVAGATSGTFTISFNGSTTAALQYNAAASDIQTALNSINSIAGVGGSVVVLEVPGSTNVFSVIFEGSFSLQTAVATMTATITALNSGSAVTINATGAPFATGGASLVSDTTVSTGAALEMAASNEVQTVTVTASGGSFNLTFQGQTTDDIAYNTGNPNDPTGALAVQNELNSLARVPTGDPISVIGT